MESNASITYRYAAFISYSHADSKWAKRLQRQLESFSTNKKIRSNLKDVILVGSKLRPIFRDEDELPASSDLSETIDLALQQSRCLVVLVSQSSAASRWVNAEIERFIKLGRADRIFFVRIPEATSEEDSLFFQYSALENRSGFEPLILDIRARSNRKLNFQKLIAALCATPLTEISKRHRTRDTRRALATTVLAITITAGTISAGVFWQATQESKRATAIAGINEQTEALLADYPDRWSSLGDRLLDIGSESPELSNSAVSFQRAVWLSTLNSLIGSAAPATEGEPESSPIIPYPLWNLEGPRIARSISTESAIRALEGETITFMEGAPNHYRLLKLGDSVFLFRAVGAVEEVYLVENGQANKVGQSQLPEWATTLNTQYVQTGSEVILLNGRRTVVWMSPNTKNPVVIENGEYLGSDDRLIFIANQGRIDQYDYDGKLINYSFQAPFDMKSRINWRLVQSNNTGAVFYGETTDPGNQETTWSVGVLDYLDGFYTREVASSDLPDGSWSRACVDDDGFVFFVSGERVFAFDGEGIGGGVETPIRSDDFRDLVPPGGSMVELDAGLSRMGGTCNLVYSDRRFPLRGFGGLDTSSLSMARIMSMTSSDQDRSRWNHSLTYRTTSIYPSSESPGWFRCRFVGDELKFIAQVDEDTHFSGTTSRLSDGRSDWSSTVYNRLAGEEVDNMYTSMDLLSADWLSVSRLSAGIQLSDEYQLVLQGSDVVLSYGSEVVSEFSDAASFGLLAPDDDEVLFSSLRSYSSGRKSIAMESGRKRLLKLLLLDDGKIISEKSIAFTGLPAHASMSPDGAWALVWTTDPDWNFSKVTVYSMLQDEPLLSLSEMIGDAPSCVDVDWENGRLLFADKYRLWDMGMPVALGTTLSDRFASIRH